MNLIELTKSGHFTKVFDPQRHIPEDVVDILLRFLHSVPASVNAQPSHFIVARDQQSRTRIANALGDPFNISKILNCSHVIVFATRETMTSEFLDEIHAKELADGKFPDAGRAEQWRSIVRGWIDKRRYDLKDLQHWMEKQTYLALGMILMAAAEMGVDASPIEGFNPQSIDQELGLREQGFTATVLLALGYRGEGDFNVGSPKSRLPMERHITLL